MEKQPKNNDSDRSSETEFNENDKVATLPMLTLRDAVLIPNTVVPIFIARPHSIRAIEAASINPQRPIVLALQKNADIENPTADDIFNIACIGNVLQVLRLPDGSQKALIETKKRIKIISCNLDELNKNTENYESDENNEDKNNKDNENSENNFPSADFIPLQAIIGENNDTQKVEALRRALISQYDKFCKLQQKVYVGLISALSSIDDRFKFADTLAAHLSMNLENRQKYLTLETLIERLEFLLTRIESEIDILSVQKRIQSKVKKQVEKNNRDYYLNEQIKALQKELGDEENDVSIFVNELVEKIEKNGLSKEAKTRATKELKKLKMMHPRSPESESVRNYLETLVNLPWSKKTKVSKDLAEAETILNTDHYGLDKVKERILEYLAVQQRVDKVKAPILCLVGPPGVGKTSLGQSIARATQRKFVRMALGGVRDEAEIRGHRRTYIGSMPGKILQNLNKVGVRNPLFLLDEVDKIGQDYKGDPAAALLEVLDPEQNNTFQDNYVEVDFDLSDVMFVATANSLNIPPALLDRMEVIRLSGYTEEEKMNIGEKYLLPKQIKNNGLKDNELKIDNQVLLDIVRYYTREAGVRSLEREISKICRKAVKTILLDKNKTDKKNKKDKGDKNEQNSTRKSKKISAVKSVEVNSKNLNEFLGVKKFSFGIAEKQNKVGLVTGLAWTEVGGELLTIECVTMPGKGNILRTGSLGDVMKESVEAAKTVVRARCLNLGIDPKDFEKNDVHIHVPEGATPKDGPSAGIAMTTALVSAFTKIPVRCDICMTGEITLRGEVLAIGGLKEKLLAAVRGGIKTALIPKENVKDLEEIGKDLHGQIKIIPVQWIDEVLQNALEYLPKKNKKQKEKNKK